MIRVGARVEHTGSADEVTMSSSVEKTYRHGCLVAAGAEISRLWIPPRWTDRGADFIQETTKRWSAERRVQGGSGWGRTRTGRGVIEAYKAAIRQPGLPDLGLGCRER